MAFSADMAFEYIERAWEGGRLSHAYLISGLDAPRRRDFATRVVNLVNRTKAPALGVMTGGDVTFIEPESKSRQITVDQIRALEHPLNLKAAAGKWKIGIVVDADRMNPAATNAFLKTLEEPPPDSLLLLLSGAPAQLLETVLSRCTKVALFDRRRPDPEDRPAADRQLIAAVAEHFTGGLTPARALALVGAYSGILAGLKEEIGAANEAAHKREIAHYQKTTDAARWLKDREDYYDALTSAQYLQARSALLQTLLSWFGDLLRHQAGHTRLDFPDYSQVQSTAAKSLATPDLLERLRCLEDLARYYETTVNEALATELAFLGAFG